MFLAKARRRKVKEQISELCGRGGLASENPSPRFVTDVKQILATTLQRR